MNLYKNTYAILMNGPPGLGKTEAMKYLDENLYVPFRYASCKDSLHKTTMSFFGVEESRYYEIYNTRDLKKTPLEEFRVTLTYEDGINFLDSYLSCSMSHSNRREVYGAGCGVSFNLTIREAMIYISEVIMKPRLGVTIFGQHRANSLKPGEIIIDDSTAAFNVGGVIQADELTPLIDKIGNDNILLLRLHREGFDFSGDSRRYVPDGVCNNTIDITNVDELRFYREVYTTICGFLISKGRI